MDRIIEQSVINKARNRRYLLIAGIVVALVAAVWVLRGTIQPTLKRSSIQIAKAERGDVENTLTASGEVLPEFEQIMTAPISAAVRQVFLNEGAAVKMGDKILELDKETARLDFEQEKDQVELKRNGIVKLKLELDKSYYDLKIQDSIKAFRINAIQADLENAKRLYKTGGGTREAIEKVENDLRIAQLEKRQLENDLRTRQMATQASIRESELTTAIQEKGLQEFALKLKRADIVAARAGVLTFVNKNIGAKVGEGEVLARVADLGSFRIMGSISDVYASQLRVGMPLVVRINDDLLKGTLVNVYPSVQNNIVSFDVSLDQKNNALLRPKLKVELFLVTEAHRNVVRVRNGAAFKSGQLQDVFVMRTDGVLERRAVRIGLANFDFVEIVDGIAEGEQVVISDMSRFKNAQELTVQQ